MCDEVHQTLHHECRLGSPSAAIGRVGRFVGGDDGNRDVVVGYVIGAEQVDGGIDRRADADRHVSARILQQTVADRQNATFGIERDLDLMTVIACVRSVENMFEPVFDPFDRSTETARKIGN